MVRWIQLWISKGRKLFFSEQEGADQDPPKRIAKKQSEDQSPKYLIIVESHPVL